MRGGLRSSLFICALCYILFVFEYCTDKGNAWRGSVEAEGQVTVIKNPSIGIFPTNIVELQEDYLIHQEDASATPMLNRPCSLVLDKENNLYVLDSGNSNVVVFNNQGDFLRTIGKKGVGPGELDTPVYMGIFRNEIAVYCPQDRRLTFFSTDGQYMRMLHARANLVSMQIDTEGNVFAMPFLNREGHGKYELQKYDRDLNYLKTIISCDWSPVVCCFVDSAKVAPAM